MNLRKEKKIDYFSGCTGNMYLFLSFLSTLIMSSKFSKKSLPPPQTDSDTESDIEIVYSSDSESEDEIDIEFASDSEDEDENLPIVKRVIQEIYPTIDQMKIPDWVNFATYLQRYIRKMRGDCLITSKKTNHSPVYIIEIILRNIGNEDINNVISEFKNKMYNAEQQKKMIYYRNECQYKINDRVIISQEIGMKSYINFSTNISISRDFPEDLLDIIEFKDEYENPYSGRKENSEKIKRSVCIVHKKVCQDLDVDCLFPLIKTESRDKEKLVAALKKLDY